MTRAEYEAEIERRNRLVDAAGLPPCDWLADHSNPSTLPVDIRAIKQLIDEIKAHTATCPTCVARDEYANAHFGPLPTPTPTLWQRIELRLLTLPEWLQPAFFGALGIGAIVFFRVLFSLGSRGLPIRMGLAAIGLGMAGGAAGGLVFSATRPLLRKLGALGDYLSGIVAVAGYLGALLWMFSVVSGESQIKDRAEGVIFALITVVFGLFGAYSWRRNQHSRS